jgi:hypothetical protein
MSKRLRQRPIAIEEEGGKVRYEHPAFATVQMSITQGGDVNLFGSSIKHSRRVRISVQRADVVRNLNSDWIHSDNHPIVEFEMSHAQLAQFITSTGCGTGTPVTLRYAPDADSMCIQMPEILPIETKAELIKREIVESADEGLEGIKKQIEELGRLIESGKTSKAALKEIHRNLQIVVGNLPSNMLFAVEQAEEALEEATSAAKIEVENHFKRVAQDLGLKQLQAGNIGNLLEHKEE